MIFLTVEGTHENILHSNIRKERYRFRYSESETHNQAIGKRRHVSPRNPEIDDKTFFLLIVYAEIRNLTRNIIQLRIPENCNLDLDYEQQTVCENFS